VVRVSLALLLLLWPACGKRDAELTRCASDGLQLARAVAFSSLTARGGARRGGRIRSCAREGGAVCSEMVERAGLGSGVARLRPHLLWHGCAIVLCSCGG